MTLKIIKKVYYDKAKCFDIIAPLSRMTVEKNILEIVKPYLFSNVIMPVYLYSTLSPSCLYMSYCDGKRLRSLHIDDWLLINNFQIVFKAIFTYLQILESKANIIFEENYSDQKIIMRDIHKLKNPNGYDNFPRAFCFGDLGLNNIIYDEKAKAFSLIDFDLAHIGYEGFDIGQLLAQFYVYFKRKNKMIIFGQLYSLCCYNCDFNQDYVNNIISWFYILTDYYMKTNF